MYAARQTRDGLPWIICGDCRMMQAYELELVPQSGDFLAGLRTALPPVLVPRHKFSCPSGYGFNEYAKLTKRDPGRSLRRPERAHWPEAAHAKRATQYRRPKVEHMPIPDGDRAFVRMFMDVAQWVADQNQMVCTSCASSDRVKQGARNRGGRINVWACKGCQDRYKKLTGNG